jgi:CRP/FNR family transcriptional regulator
MSLFPKLPKNEQISCKDCSARRYAWFKKCKKTKLENLQEYRSTQSVIKAGDYLFMEGETPRHAYTLQEGWVICFKTLSNGQRQVLSVVFSGDYLGYQTDMNKPLGYSAQAATDCRVCSFSEANIAQLLMKEPELIQTLLEIQGKQAAECQNHLSYVGQASAKLRTAYFLAKIIEKLEKRGVDIRQRIEFPLTHEDVADAVGVSSVHMSRVSSELRRDEIIDCRHNHIHVLDFKALHCLAGSIFE